MPCRDCPVVGKGSRAAEIEPWPSLRSLLQHHLCAHCTAEPSCAPCWWDSSVAGCTHQHCAAPRALQGGSMAGFEHHLWEFVCLEAAALSPAPRKAKMLSYSIPHPLTNTSHYNSMPKTFPQALCISFLPTQPCGVWKGAGLCACNYLCSHCLGILCRAKLSHPAWPC